MSAPGLPLPSQKWEDFLPNQFRKTLGGQCRRARRTFWRTNGRTFICLSYVILLNGK